jgi:hypothetical protein
VTHSLYRTDFCIADQRNASTNPSPWHLVAIVRNSQQRRIIFFLDPIGSDRWRWPVLKLVHMSHPANVVIGSACCWARAVGCKASALPSPAMNSRRRISHVSEPLYGEQSIATTGTASGIRGEIPSIFFAAREAGCGPTLPSSLSSATSGSWGEAAVASRHRDRRC